MDDGGYVRCSHCRGFYEVERARCKWCGYDTVFFDAAGGPTVWADRAAARAVQVAEFKALPPEAHADCFKPPIDMPDLLCGCLHCGPGGFAFEAIEMRWHPVERVWCCPCTTCGGRGFEFDVHPIELTWQCARCGHRFKPPGRAISANAICPACGAREINGWFDDEDDEEDFDDELDAAQLDADSDGEADAVADDDEALPWDDGATGDPVDGARDWSVATEPWYPGKDDDDEARQLGGEPRLPDDIDHPRRQDADGERDGGSF